MQNRNKNGFTLIELLVVIAIIVLLISMLAPALEKAMAAAQSAKCGTQVRKMSLAMKEYSLANRGDTLNCRQSTDGQWFHLLAEYFGESDALDYPPGQTYEEYVANYYVDYGEDQVGGNTGQNVDANSNEGAIPSAGIMKTIQCPSASEKYMPRGYGAGSGPSQQWYWMSTTAGYAVNYWMIKFDLYDGYLTPEKMNWKVMPKYANAGGNLPMFMDSRWVDVGMDNLDRGNEWRIKIKRHNGKGINIGYTDGSASQLDTTSERFYQTRWHQ